MHAEKVRDLDVMFSRTTYSAVMCHTYVLTQQEVEIESYLVQLATEKHDVWWTLPPVLLAVAVPARYSNGDVAS